MRRLRTILATAVAAVTLTACAATAQLPPADLAGTGCANPVNPGEWLIASTSNADCNSEGGFAAFNPPNGCPLGQYTDGNAPECIAVDLTFLEDVCTGTGNEVIQYASDGTPTCTIAGGDLTGSYGNLQIGADKVGTTELDFGADTPVAGECVVVSATSGKLDSSTCAAAGGDLKADGTVPLTANWDAGSYEIRAQTLESDVTTGTAPMTIASTTKVANLNCDILDDQSGAYYLDSANWTGTNATDLTDAGSTTLHTHDHGGLGGLSDDDHTGYARLAGRSSGQTLNGGTVGGVNEVQTVTVDATSGNFTLTYDGQTTANIAYNAGAATVVSRLEALSNIDNVDATGTLSGGMAVAFTGTLTETNVVTMSATDVTLAGGGDSVTVTPTTAGVDGDDITIKPNSASLGNVYLGTGVAYNEFYKTLLVGKTVRSATGDETGQLEADVNSTATNSPKTAARFSSRTSGTAVAGFGTQVALAGENGAGTERTFARWVAELSDATDGSEDVNVTLECKRAGADADCLVMDADSTDLLQPLATGSGGFGGTTAAEARTNLDLQQQDPALDDLAVMDDSAPTAGHNLVPMWYRSGGLATFGSLNLYPNTVTLLGGTSYDDWRSNLSLVIGTNVQARDATLDSLSSLGTAGSKFAYTTGVDTWAQANITAEGRALLDDTSVAAQRTTLGVPATSEAFVTIGASGGLTSERALTGTANEITVTDNGANSSVVIDIPTNPTLGLANGTGLPISTGVSGLGTGVATALAATPNATGGAVLFSGNIGAATGTSLDLATTGTGGISLAQAQSVWLGGLGTGSRIRQNASASFVLSTGAADRITVTSAGAVTIAQTLGVTGTTTLAGCDATSIGATTPGTGAFTTLERKQGSASDTVKVGGRVYVNVSSVLSSSSAYNDLMTHNVAASTLAASGDSLHVRAVMENLTTAANTAQWKLTVDGDTVFESTASVVDGYEYIEADIYRTSATAGLVAYRYSTAGADEKFGYVLVSPSNWSNAITVEVNGKDSGGGSELAQHLFDINYLPANN